MPRSHGGAAREATISQRLKHAFPEGLAKRLESMGLGLGLATLGIVVALSVVSTLTLLSAARSATHTDQVIESIDVLSGSLSEAISWQRGFSSTGDGEEHDDTSAADACRDAERRVRALTSDNLSQQRRLDDLEPRLAHLLGRLDVAIASQRTGGRRPDQEASVVRETSAAYAAIREWVGELAAEERRGLARGLRGEAIEYLFGTGQHAGRDLLEMPALVLLDSTLPLVSGLEVLRRTREDARTSVLPVVIRTASREDGDEARGYALGVNAYVRKPVGFAEFAEAVKTLGLSWLALNQQAPPRPGAA
jgi:two-component system response regulator